MKIEPRKFDRHDRKTWPEHDRRILLWNTDGKLDDVYTFYDPGTEPHFWENGLSWVYASDLDVKQPEETET